MYMTLRECVSVSEWPSGLRRQTQGCTCLRCRLNEQFWSSSEGVGSNPTSDKLFSLSDYIANCQ